MRQPTAKRVPSGESAKASTGLNRLGQSIAEGVGNTHPYASQAGQFDDALKVTKTLIEAADENGSGWYFLRLKAFVEREAGKNDAAIKTHLEVIEKLDSAKSVISRLEHGLTVPSLPWT